MRTPWLRLGVWGSAKAPPAGPDRARPPNVFWCILGIILHLFECYKWWRISCDLFSIWRPFFTVLINCQMWPFYMTRNDEWQVHKLILIKWTPKCIGPFQIHSYRYLTVIPSELLVCSQPKYLRSARPIFTIFAPYGRYWMADDQSDLLF